MKDNRIILTLDAGGTNFLFSAMQDGKEIVPPVHLSTDSSNLDVCINQLKTGFKKVIEQLDKAPSAISFAFPGPADYPKGIIGDLCNFPCFCGGVPLGPILEEEFGIPVYINNDGDLFAYGEALMGSLPQVNARLEAMGSNKRFHNLIGVTFGTGYGCGVVIDGNLLQGDNSAGGDIWCVRNKKYPELIVEESVSIRAVKRVYAERSGDTSERTPKDIFDIAEGLIPGNQEAARASFAELGEIAADALTNAITLVDGIVAIGGGLSGAAKYILPALVDELNGSLGKFDGSRFPRLEVKAYNLNDESIWEEFARGKETEIAIPGTDRKVIYDSMKRIGVMTTQLKTSQSIAMGAYVYALNQLDKQK
ncbi:MAG: ROK family protein [Bacteroides sp.]|nr:ROK family protein [Bacteroides sp.]MBP3678843.1 ROK family protein [Bacteroidaceae bacterium]MBQ4056815.1 ROK family protein [Bacteroidaceae bacterium]MBR6621428.1 ROK family protein [Bacteroides sp.]